ncbi:MFS transporter [Trinickia sp. LjRoot230]|uniref:MFS transporter n=1 Tax=Trinickia sp. LjRoot230 TaxID=3342288 RepID=UPI003ED110EC
MATPQQSAASQPLSDAPSNMLRPVLGALGILALGTFAVGTDAFVIAGLIPMMAADLKSSVVQTGQLVTLFAVAYAISSPLVAALTARWRRRTLLISAQSVFVLGTAMQAMGHDLRMVAAGRVIAAVGAAGYTAAAASLAGALVAPALRGRALAVVLGGMTLATVFGVPIGLIAGNAFGWRATLWGVAALGACAAAATFAVPSPPVAVAGLRTRLAVLARPNILPVLSVTVATLAGGFTMYTYLPVLLAPVITSGASLSLMLLVFGVAGAIGNAFAGHWTDRIGPLPVLRLSTAAIAIVALSMPFARHHLAAALVALVVWPCAGWATGVPQQWRLMALAPDAAPVALGWNASANYVGIALGGALGGIVLHSASAAWLGPVSAVCLLIALLLTNWRQAPARAAHDAR